MSEFIREAWPISVPLLLGLATYVVTAIRTVRRNDRASDSRPESP